MKIKNIFFYSSLIMLSVLMACSKGGDDHGPSISAEEAAVLNNLTGTWNIVSVLKNEEEIPTDKMDFSEMVLVYSANLGTGADKIYTVTGGDLTFPDVTDATWSFLTGSDFKVIQRDDGTLMRIISISENELVLQQDETENLLEPTSARKMTIGRFIYTFSK